ncbi:hypothetical protein F4825DRAFT_175404 [Nemania diffusa]|nr:hypothetical protein F4825DRAFT_175404 [Nemania diffusa]
MATPGALSGDCGGAVIPASPTDSMRFRQSCDRCQNNKVKCSREKPTCKRCSHRRMKCVYSPFRKIGRPRKAISGEAVPSFSEEQQEGEDDDRENESSASIAREASTLSPSDSHETTASTLATSLCDSRVCQLDSSIIDVPMEGSDNLPLDIHSQITASPQPLLIRPNHSDDLFRSVVDTWISDHHQLSGATQSSPQVQPESNNTVASRETFVDGVAYTNTPQPSHIPESEEATDCYSALLMRTATLEQALARTTVPPPIDTVLEAERDFNVIQHRISTCAGHKVALPPSDPNVCAQFSSQDVMSRGLCLTSDRPVLLSLVLLAERVIGMLESMFHLAARSAQSMDRANDFLWSATPGVSSLSARRLQRSLRSSFIKPCVSLEMESHRDLRIGNFVVQTQAKSDAMGRILKLRVQRMLSALESLETIRRTTRAVAQKRGQPSSNPLDWGGSTAVFSQVTGTLLDDLRRRTESMQGAMMLL